MIEPKKIVRIRLDTPNLLDALDNPISLALQIEKESSNLGYCPTHFVLCNHENSLEAFPLEPLLGQYVDQFKRVKSTMQQVLSTNKLLYPLPPGDADGYLLWFQRLLLNPSPLVLLDNATGRILGCSQGYSDLSGKSLAFWQNDTANNTRWEPGALLPVMEAMKHDRANGIAAPSIREHSYKAEHCDHAGQLFEWISSFQFIPSDNAPEGLRLTEIHSVRDNCSVLFGA